MSDPCLIRLKQELEPLCENHLCTDKCCHALIMEDYFDCSDNWRDAYRIKADEIRKQFHETCSTECDSRVYCKWTTQLNDSPCFNSDCESYYRTSVMTEECMRTMHEYCSAHSHQDYFVDKITCSELTSHHSMYSMAIEEDNCTEMILLTQQDKLRTTYNTTANCYDLVEMACLEDGCKCFVPEFATANWVLLLPCIFSVFDFSVRPTVVIPLFYVAFVVSTLYYIFRKS